jgi:hypothetical protein
MGKRKDPVWAHFKHNPDKEDVKHPWVDLYEGEAHGSNATRLKVWLAFDSPLFAKQRPASHLQLLRSLERNNLKNCKEEDVRAWEYAQRSVQRAAGGAAAAASGAAGSSDTHLPSALVAAGVYGGSVACVGLPAARLQLAAVGESFMDKFADKVSNAELERLCALQAKWIFGDAVNLTGCDSEDFIAFITALRPAVADNLLTYECMRCARACVPCVPC